MESVRKVVTGLGCLTLISLFAVPVSTVEAKKNLNKLLEGDYDVSLTASCAVDFGGFDPVLLQRQVGGFSLNIAMKGLLHFNGDGTGTFVHQRLRNVSNLNAAGDFPLIQADGTCDVTYTVHADGSFTQQWTCLSTLLKGKVGVPTVPQTLTETGIQLEGKLGLQRRILLLTGTSPVEEIATFSGSPNTVFKRICGRNGTGVKVRSGEDD